MSIYAVRPAGVVVLAAGEGTRMKSSIPKVLHPLLGKPILGHVLDAVNGTDPENVVVVVGHQRERVIAYLEAEYPAVQSTVQEQQNGTGHAVRCALEALDAQGVARTNGPVLVVAGDSPLITADTLSALLEAHVAENAAVTDLSAQLPDPTGYGRVVRDHEGYVLGIVEQKDATEAQRAIREVNSGMFAFDLAALREALALLSTDNSQGEEYLTDVLAIARENGRKVAAFLIADSDQIHGINDKVQLAAAARLLRERINVVHMRNGVTITDPATVWIEPGAVIEADAVIERNSHIDARSRVAARAVIGPDTTLRGAQIGEGATVLRSHVIEAVLEAGASTGPFTYLRPGAHLGPGSRVGAFCEVKQADIGAGSKVPHLSYVGDATIGEGTNIGAATVFVNYDGVEKHRTVVGSHVRVGSDSMLVAPLQIGDGAYTAAGSVVTENVPAGSIAIGRARQINIEGWVERRRAGTKSATAARRALDSETGQGGTPDPGGAK